MEDINRIVDDGDNPKNAFYKIVARLLRQRLLRLEIQVEGSDELAVLNATTKSSIVPADAEFDVDNALYNNKDEDGVFIMFAYDIITKGWYSFRVDDIKHYSTPNMVRVENPESV
tara:strand:- start:444 stop:788 length:345 start_codon:yes stop_codon:yes gene_type:complete